MDSGWRARHGAERDRLLASAVDVLGRDERFVAAWLTGSFGRGDDDGLSDVDLTVVVADADAERLCRREHQVGAGTTLERWAVLQSIGTPAIVHENHNNTLPGQSFTTCVYSSGVIFDWVFAPQASARRPAETRVLFDRVGIPDVEAAPPLTEDERIHRLSEQTAFFWMMIVPTAKALLRDDLIDFHQMLEMLHRVVANVEGLLAHQPPRYARGSRAPFLTAATARRDAVASLCERMMALSTVIAATGASVPEAPIATVAPWLAAL